MKILILKNYRFVEMKSGIDVCQHGKEAIIEKEERQLLIDFLNGKV
jgi:hypothetical protein